jgi:hypothetical protein
VPPIARPEPELQEPARDPVREPVELGVRQTPAAIDDGQRVGALARVALEVVVERAVRPRPLAHVPLDRSGVVIEPGDAHGSLSRGDTAR